MGTFPRQEALYFGFVKIAVAYLIANATRFGITAARQAALTTALNTYTSAFNKTSNLATRTKSDTADRKAAKAILSDLLRDTFDGLSGSLLNPTDRNTLNLPERAKGTPNPVPTTRPVAVVNTTNRLQHTIFFADEATPNAKGKPKGVMGCEIWYAIGGASAPADPKGYKYMATDTASPYIATFDGADANKVVYYIFRWINTRGQAGPWSATVMATITA